MPGLQRSRWLSLGFYNCGVRSGHLPRHREYSEGRHAEVRPKYRLQRLALPPRQMR